MRLQCAELLRDARNLELLRLLRQDPRISISELARRIGMSSPAVRERVLRLEEAGIIAATGLSSIPWRWVSRYARSYGCARRPDDRLRWPSWRVACLRSASVIASPAMTASS